MRTDRRSFGGLDVVSLDSEALVMLGEEIHGYRVERALSEDKGGFGDVYVARHARSGAEAILKVLKPDMSASHEIVARFFNEARAAAAIQHPSIVAVHNVGYHGGRAYLLMERLRGEDLETRLTRGPLPIPMALRFLRQAAGAIGAAHEHGIIHRDLKPANLFVVPDPEVLGGERIKVLDFGIAKLGVGGTMKTQGVFGTPAYMAPEQCTNAADVDARTDLYALGCIAFEMITGRPPFGHGGLELIASHLRDEPPRLRQIVPTSPPVVDSMIMRLLKKPREQRPASCDALIREIDNAIRLSDTDVAPPMVPPPPPPGINVVAAAPTISRRSRMPWLLGGLALLLVAAIAVVAFAGFGADGGNEVSKLASARAPQQGMTTSEQAPLAVEVTPIEQPDAAASDSNPESTYANLNDDNKEPGPMKEGKSKAPTRSSSRRMPPAPPTSSTAPAPSEQSKRDDTSPCISQVDCLLRDKPLPCCSRYGSGDAFEAKDDTKDDKINPESGLPWTLETTHIRIGISRVRPSVELCGRKHNAVGTVKVSVKVSGSGAVTSVSVSETPDDSLGKCVALAVEEARFARSERGASFKYPFSFP